MYQWMKLGVRCAALAVTLMFSSEAFAATYGLISFTAGNNVLKGDHYGQVHINATAGIVELDCRGHTIRPMLGFRSDNCPDADGIWRSCLLRVESSQAIVRLKDCRLDGGNITEIGLLAQRQDTTKFNYINVVDFWVTGARMAGAYVRDWHHFGLIRGEFSGNGTGVYIDSTPSELDHVTALDNGNSGIIVKSSPGTRVVDSLTERNGPAGLSLIDSPGASVQGHRADGNQVGISLRNSKSFDINSCEAYDNEVGILINNFSGGGVIRASIAIENNLYDLFRTNPLIPISFRSNQFGTVF